MPHVVITTEPLFKAPGEHLDVFAAAGFTVGYPPRTEMQAENEVIQALANADAVLAGGDIYSAAVLARLPRLRVISRAGVGYDRIDVEAATRQGIAVAITPTANHEGVAEHTLALLLAAARQVVTNDGDVRAGRWPKPRLAPLRGRTLGLIGLGRIGRSVAARAAAFRLRVMACDPWADRQAAARLGVALVALDELLAEADYVSLHAPLSPATRGLICRKTLAQMKPGSYLINTARGGLVVEPDLVEALRSGHLAGAALDVLAVEPPAADHPLFALPNVVFTSHTAGCDRQALRDMAVCAARNIVDLYQGRWPDEAIVNAELRQGWSW